ncbi:CBS domain-containing protein [Collimonas sp. OK242]|uniref:CBS domain-containing protein n=1 Tax=Collimonas sp. OK242 TaxID=1798195 RepID=UPI0008955228|nr:CBS domain-containing protein [Collimonas sp. OK242]SDY55963.1 CBS domain-containing protein [Collimonas sp. OK242]
MNEPISIMMQKLISTVDMDDSVEEVEAKLRINNVSAVPVIEGKTGAVIGIISARDLLRFHAEKRDPAALLAWEICSYRPIEVSSDTPVSEVAKLMVTHGMHHIVVTDNKLVKGIVSSFDFVKRFIHDD